MNKQEQMDRILKAVYDAVCVKTPCRDEEIVSYGVTCEEIRKASTMEWTFFHFIFDPTLNNLIEQGWVIYDSKCSLVFLTKLGYKHITIRR